MSEIELRSVGKSYGSVAVLNDISLEMGDGEFVVLVGPSGCGKSTLLRMIAGLEDISAGEITIGGKVVNDMPAKERDIAMVFQSYALYPHMKVAENMSFALKLAGAPKAEIQKRVTEAAEILGLESCWTACRGNSPAASVSVLPWVAPSCAIREPSSSTSRFRTSMPSCA